MKSKKLLACLMAGTMLLSMAACGNTTTSNDAEPTSAPTEAPTPEPTPEPTPVPEEVSIDFEDGNMGFVSVYTVPANADASEIAIADFNGSKALQVTNVNGDVPHIGIDVASLLGADVEKLATMEFSVGTSNAAGTFYATSGEIIAWSGEDLVESKDAWSVYLETANPKKAVATLSEGEEFVADCNNLFIINLKDDPGAAMGYGNATMYIDNIRFLDADGNVLKVADTSVEFAGPESFSSSGVDMTNIAALTKAVEFPGYATAAGGWTQAGFDMPQEVIDALVPGSVLEIAYKSDTGNIWTVWPAAAKGWMRVGVGDADGSGQGYAYTNNSKSVAQITYETLAEWLGEDKTTWGVTLQCESDGAWEVYSVKVGQAAPVYALTNTVEFPGYATSAGAWTQAGFDMPQEVIDALVPGSVLEIAYTSETGDLWTVWPASAKGWMRVGVGDADGSGQGYAQCDGNTCYITYETLAEWLGEDVSTWGTTLQCESTGAWEVYSVKVGTGTSFKPANKLVSLEGSAFAGGGWAQVGCEMTPEFIAALVPGSVINISYTSETGEIWLVVPNSAKGWMRVGVGNYDGSGQGFAACDGMNCQITFETLAEWLGDDVSTWGTTLQCEATSNWEVYGITVGQSPVAAE